MVAISREGSAACAAASPTALYYTNLQHPPGSKEPHVASSVTTQTVAEKKPQGVTGFFGKWQKAMDKSIQKVEKTFESFAGGMHAQETSGPTSKEASRAGAQPVVALNSEEEQLQWALRASMATQQGAAMPNETVQSKAAQGAAAQDATQMAQRLQAAESRAERAERDLEKAQAMEATAVAERETLRSQLKDNEQLVRGLTQQLDVVNAQIEEQRQQCQAFETALHRAQESAAAAAARQGASEERVEEAELDQQGTISQLLARIAELEATLLCATQFAQPEVETNPSQDEAAAAEADRSTKSSRLADAKTQEAEAPLAQDVETKCSAPNRFEPKGEEIKLDASAQLVIASVAENATTVIAAKQVETGQAASGNASAFTPASSTPKVEAIQFVADKEEAEETLARDIETKVSTPGLHEPESEKVESDTSAEQVMSSASGTAVMDMSASQVEALVVQSQARATEAAAFTSSQDPSEAEDGKVKSMDERVMSDISAKHAETDVVRNQAAVGHTAPCAPAASAALDVKEMVFTPCSFGTEAEKTELHASTQQTSEAAAAGQVAVVQAEA
eukprot:TRINITY_DN62759_c0_g1_i1.p1 TRINITY_DN62759_c0_g1~~TRINITY_DN62759_c0_g1_i1.p1  ORF type:complete len:624 (-),score=135.51 TRINITY_DN62759_c0_g1_i1:228-1922(-)